MAYRTLLELVHQTVLKPSPELKAKLPTFSKKVANTVGDMCVWRRRSMHADWVNPTDPNVITENKLLHAANLVVQGNADEDKLIAV